MAFHVQFSIAEIEASFDSDIDLSPDLADTIIRSLRDHCVHAFTVTGIATGDITSVDDLEKMLTENFPQPPQPPVPPLQENQE